VAARLRKAGAVVLTTARTRPDELTPQELFVAADVATPEGCAWSRMPSCNGSAASISWFMSSAARRLPRGLRCSRDDEWHRALDHNLFAAVRLDRALLPKILTRAPA